MKQSLGFGMAILLAVNLLARAQSAQSVRLVVQPFIRACSLPDHTVRCNAAFSADGKLLATSAGQNGVVATNVIDVATGVVVRSLEVSLPDGVLAGPVFDRQGNVLIAGGTGDVYTWDLVSGKAALQTIPTLGTITAITMSSDATVLLIASQSVAGPIVRLLDPASLSERSRFSVSTTSPLQRIRLAELGGDTALLVLAELADPSRDDDFQIWSLRDNQKIRAFPALTAHLAPDGLRLAVSQSTGVAIVSSLTGAVEQSIDEGGHDGVVVVFSPDGQRIVRSARAELLVFTAGRLQPRHILGDLRPVALSPDGRWLLANGQGWDRDLSTLWNAESGIKVRTFSDLVQRQRSVFFAEHSPNLLAEPEHRRTPLAEAEDRSVVWNMAMGRIRASFPSADTPEQRMSLLTPDGGRFIVRPSNSYTVEVEIRDVETGAPIAKFPVDPDRTSVRAISPDSNTLVTLTTGRNGVPMLGRHAGVIRVWDLVKMEKILVIPIDEYPISNVALSSSGHRLMVGYHLWDLDQKSKAWEVPGYEEPVILELNKTDHPSAITREFFVDEKTVCLIVQGPPMTAHIWDVGARKEVSTYTVASSIAAPSPERGVLYMTVGGSVAVLDILTGKEVRRFEPATSLTTDLSPSKDGKWLAAATGEGVRLWDVASGRLKATLVSFLDGGWAVVDPEGRYDASDPDNAPGLHFVAGNDMIELGQLKQRFYTPGLLAKIWRSEELPVVQGLKDVKLVPGVEVRAPASGSFDATVRLTNRSGGIGKVIVKVNGRELPAAIRGETPKIDAKTAELRLNLEGATLSLTGKNVIEVYAENGDGSIRSRGEIATWEREQPKETVPPKLFAIVVGVSTFDNASLNLSYAAKDAVDFGHALELGAIGMGGKERTNVTVLASGSGQEPTKENIRQAFNRVAKEARASDLLVVYLAGHGVAARTEQDQYYYLTKEARSTDVDRDAGLRLVSTVSSAELKEWLYRKNMPLKQVVILDTCAAGAAFGDIVKLAERRELSPDQIRAIELLKDSTGSWILMGSAADAVSYEANRYAQGLLTYALLQGMQGAALDEDRVEVSKLFGFAQRQVGDLAKGIGGVQRPLLSAPKGQTFPIGLLKEEDRKQIHLATLKPQLLRAQALDRRTFVDSFRLLPSLRAELRVASRPVMRGTQQQEPTVVYLDSVVDEVPDALIPQVLYESSGETVKFTIRLLRNNATVAEQSLELPLGSPETLSRALAVELIAASGRIK